MMNGLLQDLRYALRQLRKSPGFTCTAVLILALGICASVAIFGFVDAALIKPLPYPNPTRLVEVTESIAMMPRANLSYLDYLDWKKFNQVFSSMDVYNETGYLLRTPAGTDPVHGIRVSDGFFRTLGITPVLGRDFHAGEDLPESPRMAVLSYTAWQERFGGRKSVIGETVTLSGLPHTVMGVLPRDFQFAPGENAEFWTPLHASDQCALRRSCHNLTGVGRLKDGISVATAFADIKTIARQLEMQYPDDNRGQGASVMPLSESIVGDIRPMLLLLLGGAGLLLVIACVNVSSLLLVRSESRKREIAVRGALGASRARLIRQFITEGFVLVAAGSVLGMAAAHGAMQILARLISKDMMASMPYLQGLSLNLHVLAFSGIVSVLAAALFSLAPMVRLPLTKLQEGLTEGGRGYAETLWRRFGANLVAVELGIAVVLLVGAGLLGKSFYRLLHVELGFQADHLATLDVELPRASYGKDEQIAAVARQIVGRIASLPGVTSVGISSVLPVSFNGNTTWIRLLGRPYHGEHNEVNQRDVSSAFFATLQARLLRGRFFTEAEDASKPHVAMINQALARKYFPGEDPVGKKIGDNTLSPASITEIVGVVEDIKDGSLDSEIWPAVYYPFSQSPDTYLSVVVRTSQAEQSLLPSLVAAVHEIDPGVGTIGEATMGQRINNSPTAYLHRSSAWLVGDFAAVALLLGVVGLYGVIAYSVSQRTREIGVRMALGAQRRSVYQLIMKEAAWLAGVGIAGGLICSIAAATLIRGLLFGVRAWDAATFVAVAALLAISAMLASYIPARRAAQVDPMVALRYE
jgi:predicted permease